MAGEIMNVLALYVDETEKKQHFRAIQKLVKGVGALQKKRQEGQGTSPREEKVNTSD